MSQRQLASVLFAVLGVFIAISRLPLIFLQVGLLVQLRATNTDVADAGYPTGYTISLLLSTLFAVLLGLVLVRISVPLAERLFPSDSQPLVARDTQAVALSVLGCYFVIQSICQLVEHGGIEWSAIVQLVLGVGLFLGARGVARFWSGARPPGSSGPNERAV